MREGTRDFVRKIRITLTVLMWGWGLLGAGLLVYSLGRNFLHRFSSSIVPVGTDELLLTLAIFAVPVAILAFLRWLLPSVKSPE